MAYLVPAFLFVAIVGFRFTGILADCIETPTNATCMHYQYPDSTRDLLNLCTAMPNMPGCSIDRICADGSQDITSSPFCKPFSVLKDICAEDMPNMMGCRNYTSMCASGSVVMQCSMEYLPLPTTMEVGSLINQICTQMNMDSCSKCPEQGMNMECDLLVVYSELCASMPDMGECGSWKDLCEKIPDWPLCSSSSNPELPPVMRMYFHTGFKDYILFKGWVPTDAGEFIGSFIAIFVAGILGEVLKLVRSILEKKWRSEREEGDKKEDCCAAAELSWKEHIRKNLAVPFKWKQEAIRATLQFLEVTWGLLLMLVAMTFNVALFLAVPLGAAAGSVLFGRCICYEPKASCCN